MTEAAPPKRFQTRQRVFVGVLGVVVILLALAGWAEVSGTEEKGKLRIKFLNFSKSEATGSWVASVSLINASGNTTYSSRISMMIVMPSRDEARGPDSINTTGAVNPPFGNGPHVAPLTNETGTLDLPNNGIRGCLSVAYWARPTKPSAITAKLRNLWWRWFRPNQKVYYAQCEQWIQCPKLLPDGTVEPPRLVSAPGAKP